MIRRFACTISCAFACVAALAAAASGQDDASTRPGTAPTTAPATTTAVIEATVIGTSTPPIGAPRGATVLFDGDTTDGWTTVDAKPSRWKVLEDDSMEVGGGNIISKEKFEDVQLHVEFWLPKHPPDVKGQHRGNSGVYLQGRYEIQVLDSFGQAPDKHGCGAIYGRRKPKENACTPPQTWQTYDITFRAPRFDEDGKKVANARVTVIHNGVTIHQDAEIEGPTVAGEQREAPGPAPVMLQDHGNPVRYRNIYALPVKPSEKDAPPPPATQPANSVRSVRP